MMTYTRRLSVTCDQQYGGSQAGAAPWNPASNEASRFCPLSVATVEGTRGRSQSYGMDARANQPSARSLRHVTRNEPARPIKAECAGSPPYKKGVEK